MDRINSEASNGSAQKNVIKGAPAETANVISAVELSVQQVSALEETLSKKLNRPVEISVKVDPSVIGGLSIHAGGILLDRTIKRQITDMKNGINGIM